jgi:hypothetical protein
LIAISNPTSITVSWFFTVLLIEHSATWTRIFFSYVSQAKTTVHPARSDQIYGKCFPFISSFWCHDLSVLFRYSTTKKIVASSAAPTGWAVFNPPGFVYPDQLRFLSLHLRSQWWLSPYGRR